MNKTKLKESEKSFLQKYPGGFNHPDMVAMGKKHNMDKIIAFTQESFAKSAFKDSDSVVQAMIKLISKSSMVSMFEKPKFKDFANQLSPANKKKMADGLKNFLHGNQPKGFEAMLEVLNGGKMAKWSIITAIGAYYHPDQEVFIKPTTAKGVISVFELKGLEYKPQPTWVFYENYRNEINKMKKLVSKTLSPSNAAFSGFLMSYI